MRYVGLSVTEVVLIVFIILKLTGGIDWSWVWVLSPMWITASLVVAVFLAIAIVVAIVRLLGAAVRLWRSRRPRKILTAADVAESARRRLEERNSLGTPS
ncbi:DUF4175 domain-containing protein [Candidatus Saccharibacteria bacterium]|nr:DUF4175 domain-containing protein [Candidatus Saccharibacteria bacterium]